jgi:hypothetical protein
LRRQCERGWKRNGQETGVSVCPWTSTCTRRGQHKKKKQKQNEKEKERSESGFQKKKKARVQARGHSRWADNAPHLDRPLSPRATGISSVARSHDGPMKSTLQHSSSAILSTADNDSRHSVCARHGRHLCHPRGVRGTLQEREDMVDYVRAAGCRLETNAPVKGSRTDGGEPIARYPQNIHSKAAQMGEWM